MIESLKCLIDDFNHFVFNLFLSYFIIKYLQILFLKSQLTENPYFKDPYTDFVPPEAQEDSPGHGNPFQVNHFIFIRIRPVKKCIRIRLKNIS